MAETEMVVSPRTLRPRSPCQIMEEAHHCESLVELKTAKIVGGEHFLMSFHLMDDFSICQTKEKHTLKYHHISIPIIEFCDHIVNSITHCQ